MQAPVLFFDGYCPLCSKAVQFVLVHERQSLLQFAPLDSAFARMTLGDRENGLPGSESFVLLEDGISYQKSDAVLRLCRYLKTPWSWCVHLRFIPRVIRDAVYQFIARNRYKWFGRDQVCWMPGAENKERFMSA